MNARESLPVVPAAPLEEEPRPLFLGPTSSCAVLVDTLAGVELGAYDRRIVDWLAGWGGSTVLTVASWIRRGAEKRLSEAGVPLLTAALLKARKRVTELEVERHSTNDALDRVIADCRKAERRVAELEAQLASEPRATDGAVATAADAIQAAAGVRKAAHSEAADWLASVGQKDAAYLLRTCDVEAGGA